MAVFYADVAKRDRKTYRAAKRTGWKTVKERPMEDKDKLRIIKSCNKGIFAWDCEDSML